MKKTIFILFVITLTLAACQSASQTSEVSPTDTPQPTAVVATETPQPQISPEVQAKFDQAGIKLEDLGTVKNDGLHITLESGDVVISFEDLNKNSYLGQENIFQYRDSKNTKVLYAFDPETKKFLERSQSIQDSNVDEEKFIQAESFDDLPEIFRREKLFMIPFDAENTYFPESDDIYANYDTPESRSRQQGTGEFNSVRPLGKLPEGKDSPFVFENYIRIKNVEGSEYPYAYIVSEKVYNLSDNSFSVLHPYSILLDSLRKHINSDGIFLPQLFLDADGYSYPPYKPFIEFYENKGLIEGTQEIPVIVELVNQWFREGKVPAQLEKIPLLSVKNRIR
jgi:hypothetical protein